MFHKITEIQAKGETSVLVTITSAKGSTPREVGAKMLVTKSEFFGSIGGGALEWMALEKARIILKSEEAQKMSVPLCSKAHQCCGGYVELFFDILRPKPQIYIFGAGHVSQALLEVLAGTAFECHVIDERSEWIEAAQRKKVQMTNLNLTAVCESPLTWIDQEKALLHPHAYAVVMTHDHALDEAIIEKLAPMPLRYLGLIGSHTKRQRFVSRLLEKGVSQTDLDQVRCPMGVPLPSKAPKEVALSLAMELLQHEALGIEL